MTQSLNAIVGVEACMMLWSTHKQVSVHRQLLSSATSSDQSEVEKKDKGEATESNQGLKKERTFSQTERGIDKEGKPWIHSRQLCFCFSGSWYLYPVQVSDAYLKHLFNSKLIQLIDFDKRPEMFAHMEKRNRYQLTDIGRGSASVKRMMVNLFSKASLCCRPWHSPSLLR